MPESALTILIKARDLASDVLAGITGKAEATGMSFRAMAGMAAAGAGAAVGALADFAREAAADQAAMVAVEQALGNAAAQFEATTRAVATGDFQIATYKDSLARLNAENNSASAGIAHLEALIRNETGTTREAASTKELYRDQIKALQERVKTNNAAIKDTVKALNESTDATARARSQLGSMGTDTATATAQLEQFILKMRDTAAVDDAELKPALAALIATTQDYAKSMELAGLAADIARGKNISLEVAAQLVGKVSEGNVSILTRYGIVLDKNATASEALAELQKRFAGQAEAYGNTTQGQLQALSIRIGDMREAVGAALGPWQGMIALLPGLSAGFSAVSGAVGFVAAGHLKATAAAIAHGVATTANTVKQNAATAAVIAHGVATTANTVKQNAATAAQWLLNIALTANPIGIVVVALAALTAGIIYAYQNSEEFRGIVDGLFGVLKGAAESTLPALKVAFDAVSGAIVWAAGEAGKLWNTINDLIGKITEFIGKIAGIPGSIGINIPGLAGGTTSFGGGLAVVGERGPELVNLPRGSSVTPLGGRGAPVTVNVYVQGSVVTERQLIDTVYDGLIQKQRSNYSLGWV